MTNPFPKNDLARLVVLPARLRVLALLAALRFLGDAELAIAGVSDGEVAPLVRDDLVLRFERTLDAVEGRREAVYALRKDGARVLAREMDVNPTTVPSTMPSECRRRMMFLDHTVARNRFALLLAEALRGRLLSWEHDTERLADAAHVLVEGQMRRVPLVADGLAVVNGQRGIEGLLVEIDRGTERPAYMARKYAAYREWWREAGPLRRFDLKALRILTVAPDERRTERLREAARAAVDGKLGGLFWFASEDALVRCAGAPPWRTLRSDDHTALWS